MSIQMFPGNTGGGGGNNVALFVTAVELGDDNNTIFTLPGGQSFVSGTITAFVGSVLVANGSLTEIGNTQIDLPVSITPAMGQAVRLVYEIL